MALKITSDNFKDNEIGKGDGGIQPSATITTEGMRLNNGAPARKGTDDEISYDNAGKKNPFLDRVISSNQNDTTTYVNARNTNAFELIDRKNIDGTDYTNDNGTPLGSVTSSGSFHYVKPGDTSTTETTETAASRKSKIEEIYMVGSVNAMSARS